MNDYPQFRKTFGNIKKKHTHNFMAVVTKNVCNNKLPKQVDECKRTILSSIKMNLADIKQNTFMMSCDIIIQNINLKLVIT